MLPGRFARIVLNSAASYKGPAMTLHHWKKNERESGTLAVYIGAFLYSAVIIFFCVFIFFRDDYKEKERLTRFYGYLFADRISRQLYDLSTDLIPLYTLASVDNWGVEDFNTTAQELAKSRPEIIAINLAPNGVVTHIFPFEANKNTLGHDLLKDEERRQEAELAKETQKITLSGPFHLRQGGIGLAFRQPIYFSSGKGENDFWGFAVIIYRFPEVLLSRVNFEILTQAEFSWRLWRIDPTDGKKVVLLHSGEIRDDFFTYEIELQNAIWHIDISPKNGFLNFERIAILVSVSLIICIAVSFLVVYFVKLIAQYRDIKKEVLLDSLTGLHNKKFFWDTFEPQLEKYLNSYGTRNMNLFLCVFDLNNFKHINDSYGHMTGDQILIEFSKKLLQELDYNEFAVRFGGDEFIAVLYCPLADGMDVPQRIREMKSRLEFTYRIGKEDLKVTVSMGALSPCTEMLVEKPAHISAAEFFLELADRRMYMEKNSRMENRSPQRA